MNHLSQYNQPAEHTGWFFYLTLLTNKTKMEMTTD